MLMRVERTISSCKGSPHDKPSRSENWVLTDKNDDNSVCLSSYISKYTELMRRVIVMRAKVKQKQTTHLRHLQGLPFLKELLPLNLSEVKLPDLCSFIGGKRFPVRGRHGGRTNRRHGKGLSSKDLI